MSQVNIDVEENDEPINIDDTEDNNADEHITLSEETIYQINPMINMEMFHLTTLLNIDNLNKNT